MRKEMIQSALDKGAGDSPNSQAVATATVNALTSLLAEIKPLVGERRTTGALVTPLCVPLASGARTATSEPVWIEKLYFG